MLDPITQKMRMLDRSQQGFSSRQSMVDAVAALHTAASSCPRGLRVILTWAIKGAYDRVPCDKLCEMISKSKLDGHLYLLVKTMLLKPSFVAVVDNELPEPQAVLGGVVQGSFLSPLLFNYTIDKAPSLVRKEGLSACAARRRIGAIAFADDTATVARSPDEAQSILDVMSTFAAEQKIIWAPENIGITRLGGNLNWVIGMYKAFNWPTMEYALEICIPNASLVKALERCQGDILRAVLGVPKSTSYAAILLLCKIEMMEHHWHTKISSYICRCQLNSDDKHILSGLFNMKRVVQMKSSRLIPRLCQEAYCAGPPHLITTIISEKKRACMHALRSASKSATRVTQIKSLGFICSTFVQHRTPIIHWLLSAVAVQPSQCQKCGGTLSRDHAADCIGATTKFGPIIATAFRKLHEQQRQRLQQANNIDAALMTLNKNDVASVIQIALVIDKIYTPCLGRLLL
ncbi:hypothetical protein GGI17_004552 [Coemansia sp. S146]|nr:hypothetical protein GGI17_004552 [Coemansia sp. S146]